MRHLFNMDTLKNIVNRDIQSATDVAEMEFVVAEYIRARKGLRVHVNVAKGLVNWDLYEKQYYLRQVKLLNQAYLTAVVWFRDNPMYL